MAFTRKYPNNISYGGSSIRDCIINDDKDIKNLYETISNEIGLSGSSNGTRQCVLSGKADINGLIDFFVLDGAIDRFQTSNSCIGINCSEKPAILVFADGFAETGARDIIKKLDDIQEDVWDLPRKEGNYYLYIECSPSTGKISYGYSTMEDVYGYNYSLPDKGANWFDKSEGIMKYYDGRSWQKVLRIFVARVYYNEAQGRFKIFRYPMTSRIEDVEKSAVKFVGSNAVRFFEGNKLISTVEADTFKGTATKALNIPVGKEPGCNIWIEEVYSDDV